MMGLQELFEERKAILYVAEPTPTAQADDEVMRDDDTNAVEEELCVRSSADILDKL